MIHTDTQSQAVSYRFEIIKEAGPIYTTNAVGLWDLFLSNVEINVRQHFNCRCCEAFIRKYGGLVQIVDGQQVSCLVGCDDPELQRAIALFRLKAGAAKITGVFYSAEYELGVASNFSKKHGHEWTHFHATVPSTRKDAEAAQAASVERYALIQSVKYEYRGQLAEAARILIHPNMHRQGEHHAAVASALASCTDRFKVWEYVATKPESYFHIRGSLLGVVLDQIKSGKSFDEIVRTLAPMTAGQNYMRPKAAPSEQTIEQAEKLFSGITSSLRRRWALVSEVPTIWEPALKEQVSERAFDHLKKLAAVKPMDTPPEKMTWEKFRATVLPECEEIKLLVPAGRDRFAAAVTATVAGSESLFRSGGHLSHYTYVNGSLALEWGLRAGVWHPVVKITDLKETESAQEYILICLEHMQDIRNLGLALFPEDLDSKYHGVRSVIEAHSNSAKLDSVEGQHACGLPIHKKGEIGYTLWIQPSGRKILIYRYE